MTTLFFVRHGQTDFSREDHFCGSLDPPLNAVGLEMADAVGVRCAPEPWDALYASPLLRTRQTAEVIGRRVGVEVALEPALREIDYGEWEGSCSAEVKARDPERYAAWVATPATVSPPGGETARAIAERAVPAIERIVSRHPGGKVLIVSHKATIRVVLCALLGIDLNLFRLRLGAPVASLSEVKFSEQGPLLAVLGDTSHLPDHLREMRGT